MKTRVMLVEDNQMNSRLIEYVLNRDGFAVIVMASAEEAIRAAANDPPDMMLMDIQLPDMDGLEATRQLKKNPVTEKIPIVAITAHAMAGDEERIRAAGCEGYISKPINTRELAETIRIYLSA
ncbi:MAG: response regulator [Thermoleophilia bacterium]